ncbi:MAG: LysM peptidoglycan-binding domain-containing protein [Chloroflexota bacterium]
MKFRVWFLLAAVFCLAVATPAPSDSGGQQPLELDHALVDYRGGGGADPSADPNYFYYTVRAGDTVSGIAARYRVSIAALVALNGLRSADAIYIGQRLAIPVAFSPTQPIRDGFDEKLIPDSEAVYSPAYADFNAELVAQRYGGYLASYTERVDGELLTGAQIIQILSERFSVGPRVLLAVLEMRSGWVTGQPASARQEKYPFDLDDRAHTGLYYQVWKAANFLNAGYYGKLLRGLDAVSLDDARARIAPSLNPGTVALQNLLAQGERYGNWTNELGANGFKATYQKLFGDPFANAIEPLAPSDLKQPLLRLPFEDNHTWYYTGGPHGAWADGSAWAAVDFAAMGPGGCAPSPEWAIAAATGRVVQSEHGRVMLNLNGANFQGTGWTVMYMHMASRGRVTKGSFLYVGDRIGHPSCEGGYATASHLHIARMFNGQWMSVASDTPFDLAGWTFKYSSVEYDGAMSRGGETHPAVNGHVARLNGVTGEWGPALMPPLYDVP